MVPFLIAGHIIYAVNTSYIMAVWSNSGIMVKFVANPESNFHIILWSYILVANVHLWSYYML